MKQFSKLYENTEEYNLSGDAGFNIFLDIINDLNILFIKHDYLNVGDYSYFFTTEKIDDNYNVANLLKRKRSLNTAYLTISSIKEMRLSFYFGVKRKTLFYGFYNEDTNYVYKVGAFNVSSSYLKKLRSGCTKNLKQVLSETDMIKMNKLHMIKKDFETLFPDVESEMKIKDGFRISKKYSVDVFNADDLDESKMNYTLLLWSRKFKWYNSVYSFVNITEKNVYFYIKMKE